MNWNNMMTSVIQRTSGCRRNIRFKGKERSNSRCPSQRGKTSISMNLNSYFVGALWWSRAWYDSDTNPKTNNRIWQIVKKISIYSAYTILSPNNGFKYQFVTNQNIKSGTLFYTLLAFSTFSHFFVAWSWTITKKKVFNFQLVFHVNCPVHVVSVLVKQPSKSL